MFEQNLSPTSPTRDHAYPSVVASTSAILCGMFRRSASLGVPHLKSFAAIPSVSLVQLGHTNRSVSCHTNRSVKLPSFRNFQDQFLITNKRSGGSKMGLCFARFLFLMFRGPLASHDSNPYPNHSRIARYNATKLPFNWGSIKRTLPRTFLCTTNT